MRIPEFVRAYLMQATSGNEAFELLANGFYRDTGIMRLGKDVAQLDSQPSDDERRIAYNDWVFSHATRALEIMPQLRRRRGERTES